MLGSCRAHWKDHVTFPHWLYFSPLHMQSFAYEADMGSEWIKPAASGLQFGLSQARLNNHTRLEAWAWTSYQKWAKIVASAPKPPSYETGCLKMFFHSKWEQEQGIRAAAGGGGGGGWMRGHNWGWWFPWWRRWIVRATSACVSASPSIYCWRHVSERLGESGPNNSPSHPENLPSEPTPHPHPVTCVPTW